MVQEFEAIMDIAVLEKNKCAFFWVADGNRYIKEAAVSMQSAKKHMPDISCYLFVEHGDIPDGFEWSIKMPPRQNRHLFLDFTNYIAIGLEFLQKQGIRHAVYLDTDIFFCAPVYEIFSITKYCDIAGAFAPARKTTAHLEDILPTSIFPEINGGVMAMNVSPMIKFFKTVYETHGRFQDSYEGNDQGVIRDVMLSSTVNDWDFRYHILPPEYNCRFGMPTFMCGEVKILHGRSDNIEKVAKDINSSTAMRVWVGGGLIP